MGWHPLRTVFPLFHAVDAAMHGIFVTTIYVQVTLSTPHASSITHIAHHCDMYPLRDNP